MKESGIGSNYLKAPLRSKNPQEFLFFEMRMI
jgi:hypothetical protein